MTCKKAFVSGVRLFCKRAGMDADDADQMERLLLMPADKARPIVKEARLAIGRVNYVRAGMVLSKAATYAAADAAARALSGESWQSSTPSKPDTEQGRSVGSAPVNYFGGSGASVPEPVSHPGGGTFIPHQKPLQHPGGTGAAQEDTYDPKTDKQNQEALQAYETRPESLRSMSYKHFMPLHKLWAAGPKHTPMEIAIGGQYSASRHQSMRATSREAMRGLNINMAPGEFAKLNDEQLAQRAQGLGLSDINSSNVGWAGETVAMRLNDMRYARDLAREELRIHGGVPSAQMGGGFNTGTAAMGAAARTPPPASSPAATAATGAAATPSSVVPPAVTAMPYAGGDEPSIEEMTAAVQPSATTPAATPAAKPAYRRPPPAAGTRSSMSGSYAGGPTTTGRSGVWDQSGKWRAS